MKSNQLTPWKVLQRKKTQLRLKSDALVEVLENDLDYIQHNFGTIIGNTIVEAVVAKTPQFVQAILPLFIRGTKGWLAQLALNVVRKWIFKQDCSKSK